MKTLIGCLTVVAVLVVGLALAGYVFVYRPIAVHVADFRVAVEDVRAAVDLEAQVRNTAPFVEPADGLLTAEHLQRFVAVQDAVAAATTTERDTLEYTWGELRTVGSGGLDTVPAPASLVATLSAFADALRATKEVQVSALDQANFSVAEYRWVQRTVLESLGVSVLPADLAALRDLDLRRLKDGAGLGGGVELRTGGKVPEPNVALVAKYRDQLDRWATMAVLGL